MKLPARFATSLREAMRFPEDAIPAAAFLFESHRGLSLGPHEVAAIQQSGLEATDPETLAHELKRMIAAENKADSRDRQQAYWALGKKRDPSLIPFFRDRLSLELRRDMIAVYQIMIALEDLDEPIFTQERSGRAMDDYELNRRDAERYLAHVD
jgi:hypothetical protein